MYYFKLFLEAVGFAAIWIMIWLVIVSKDDISWFDDDDSDHRS